MSSLAPRLVVVLGYSGWRGHALHDVCAVRLRRAERETVPEDIVLLSGWSRRRRRETEAELMARAWQGQSTNLILDRGARTTMANAVSAATVASEHDVRTVVLVTSGWHGRRAATLLAAALSGADIEVELALTAERGSLRARLREVACRTIVPLQTRVAGARARSRRPATDGARVEAA